MKRWPFGIVWLLVTALVPRRAVLADEIQTKDGKKIEFKSLVDEGDTIELTTPQGTKVSIKKSDFDKYIPSGVKEVPLTGAQFTFDKKRKLATADLLSRVDVKKDGITGMWKQAGGAIVGSGGTNLVAKLTCAYTPPEEYDLTIEATRKEGVEDLMVGLIGGGKQFTFFFDTASSSFSGPGKVDGNDPQTSGLSIPGRFFTTGKPRAFTIMVRREVLIVVSEGKDFFSWKADWSRVSLHPALAMTAKNTLFLAVGQAGYQITRWTVTAPKE
jgi:hypothetical protein